MENDKLKQNELSDFLKDVKDHYESHKSSERIPMRYGQFCFNYIEKQYGVADETSKILGWDSFYEDKHTDTFIRECWKTLQIKNKQKNKHNMERERKNFKKAFEVQTADNTYGVNKYVIIAENFAEAERLYWDKTNGYHEILSISVIPDIKGVAY